MKIIYPAERRFFCFYNQMSTEGTTPLLNGETMKKEGDLMTYRELIDTLSEFGTVQTTPGRDLDGNLNGSAVLSLIVREGEGVLAGTEYTVLVPDRKWRRVTKKDASGEVVEVNVQKDPEAFQESEVSVLMLNPTDSASEVTDKEKELADWNIKHNLDPETKTIGPEIEFNLSLENKVENFNDEVLGIVVNGIYELMACQRELGIDPPVSDTAELMLATHELLREVMVEAENKDALVNLAGTSPDLRIQQIRSLKIGDPSKYAVYVDFLSHQLAIMMEENLKLVPAETKENWDRIAKGNGFEGGLEGMLVQVKDLSHWLMNAGHVSINVEADKKTGFVSPNILKSTANLMIYFRTLVDGLTYSGGHTFGQDVLIEGKKVADARHVLNQVMLTASPADMLEPDRNLRDTIVCRMLEGQSIHPDRAGLATLIQELVMPNTHGDARLRVSIGLEKLLLILESNRNGDPEPAKGKTNNTRIEYTGRSMTPDRELYKYSVDMQEIIYKAANLATIDGYTDVFLWLNEVVGLDIDPETEYATNLDQRLLEQNSALLGEFNGAKLNNLETLTNYVNQRLLLDYQSTHPSAIGAIEGINALRNVETLRIEINKLENGKDKLLYYMSNKMGNWGEFENLLSERDIKEMILYLEHEYMPGKDWSTSSQMVADQNDPGVIERIIDERLSKMGIIDPNLGDLIMRLRHAYLRKQIYLL